VALFDVSVGTACSGGRCRFPPLVSLSANESRVWKCQIAALPAATTGTERALSYSWM